MRTINSSTSLLIRGRPGVRRFCEPSNLRATSLRYHAKMVSGRAAVATSPSALRPSRRPISPSFARSASESFSRPFNWAFRIRFSAARYSFRSSSSWSTVTARLSCSFNFLATRAQVRAIHRIHHVGNRLLSLAPKRVFNAANGVSDLALDLVAFAFALELAVSGQLPGDFLHFALCLFSGAFDPVLVNHGSSPLL